MASSTVESNNEGTIDSFLHSSTATVVLIN
jgi:hypothetical protein